MKIYLSGPITGIKDYREKFREAEEAVRVEFPNAVILNPATMFPAGMEPRAYMALSIEAVKLADWVIMLPGWERSPGANIEKAVADYCGIDVIRLDELVGYAVGGIDEYMQMAVRRRSGNLLQRRLPGLRGFLPDGALAGALRLL